MNNLKKYTRKYCHENRILDHNKLKAGDDIVLFADTELYFATIVGKDRIQKSTYYFDIYIYRCIFTTGKNKGTIREYTLADGLNNYKLTLSTFLVVKKLPETSELSQLINKIYIREKGKKK